MRQRRRPFQEYLGRDQTQEFYAGEERQKRSCFWELLGFFLFIHVVATATRWLGFFILRSAAQLLAEFFQIALQEFMKQNKNSDIGASFANMTCDGFSKWQEAVSTDLSPNPTRETQKSSYSKLGVWGL